MGNDVAAALRAGVERVDAVEIDPAILELGAALHPERPYNSPRVRLIADDARSVFAKSPDQYDMVVFGLLDSHTLLSSMSSLRLDSYVYTVESLRQARGLLAPGERVRPGDVRRAARLREALLALLLANNGERLDEAALAEVNEAAGRSRVSPALEGAGAWRLSPAGGGVDRALGELLGIVFRSMSAGTWSRLKACPDPSCRWAFYDHSRNRSGRWCKMAECGNRAKARAFRERQRTVGRPARQSR
jgi:hypothetical protein